jgi:homoserine kinase
MGPAFDALGMALTLFLEVSTSGEGIPADEHHPAVVAFRSAGGEGPLFVRSEIPPERGLGFSGAARVAGLLAAGAEEPLAKAAALEGHADNAAASLLGGVVAVSGGTAVRVPLGLDPAVVVWVPEARASTQASREMLPESVSLRDAVFNIGRTALLVAALSTGDVGALREATKDRMHQDQRLGALPQSKRAIAAALDAGAWCAWLSGSGPSVAALVSPDDSAGVAAAVPGSGTSHVLSIDHKGAVVETQC